MRNEPLALIEPTPLRLPDTLPVPLKLCPHRVRAVCNFVAEATLELRMSARCLPSSRSALRLVQVAVVVALKLGAVTGPFIAVSHAA